MEATFIGRRRSAFTLVELLVVVGLLGVLATVSVAGYNAATRGMADRGAIQSIVSMLRIAQQTCQMDRVPTKVMFFNQLLSGDGSGIDEDTTTVYQGTAIAIRQSGRITIAPQGRGMGILVDEFADWNQSYPDTGFSGQSGMRFFRMAKAGDSSDIDGCSTMVRPYVTAKELDDYMIQSGMTVKDWCQQHGVTGNNRVWGFEPQSGSLGEWKAGDAYGVEIARIDLPKGYIFGNTPPTGKKLVGASVAAVTFDPEDEESAMSPGSVPVSLMRPAVGGTYSAKSIGTVTSAMLKDSFK